MKCFLDREIVEEANNLKQLQTYVQESKCLLLILSRSLLKSKWCLLEIYWALKNKIPIILMTGTLNCKFGKNSERDFPNLEDPNDCLQTQIEFEGKFIPIPESIQKAFEIPAIPYSLDFHRESLNKLINRMKNIGIDPIDKTTICSFEPDVSKNEKKSGLFTSDEKQDLIPVPLISSCVSFQVFDLTGQCDISQNYFNTSTDHQEYYYFFPLVESYNFYLIFKG